MTWPEVFSEASKGKPAGPDRRGNGSFMEKLKQFWEFLDGKKTAIGGALLVTGNILRRFPATAVAAEIVSEVGMYLTGFGLIHKGVKASTPEGA